MTTQQIVAGFVYTALALLMGVTWLGAIVLTRHLRLYAARTTLVSLVQWTALCLNVAWFLLAQLALAVVYHR